MSDVCMNELACNDGSERRSEGDRDEINDSTYILRFLSRSGLVWSRLAFLLALCLVVV